MKVALADQVGPLTERQGTAARCADRVRRGTDSGGPPHLLICRLARVSLSLGSATVLSPWRPSQPNAASQSGSFQTDHALGSIGGRRSGRAPVLMQCRPDIGYYRKLFPHEVGPGHGLLFGSPSKRSPVEGLHAAGPEFVSTRLYRCHLLITADYSPPDDQLQVAGIL
jgi:hypothetical protein